MDSEIPQAKKKVKIPKLKPQTTRKAKAAEPVVLAPKHNKSKKAQAKDNKDLEVRLSTPQQYTKTTIQNQIKATAERFTSQANQLRQELKEELDNDIKILTGAFERYDVSGPPSRAEANILRRTIELLHKRIEEAMSTQERHQCETQAALAQLVNIIDTLSTALTNLLAQYEILNGMNLKEKLKNPSAACHFCLSPKHAGQYCRQYPTFIERIECLNEDKRCLSCFEIHSTNTCTVKIKKCKHCANKSRHRPSICPKRSSEEGIKELLERDKEMKKAAEEMEKTPEEEEWAPAEEEEDVGDEETEEEMDLSDYLEAS